MALNDSINESSAKHVKWNFISSRKLQLENTKHSVPPPVPLSVPFHLLKLKKLVLLVDLDHTLIHTTQAKVPLGIVDVHHFESAGSWYHTRVRPGTRAFLKNMSELFEMHIWTYGDRPYSNEIARLLDPHSTLFSKRILSRDEFIDPNTKSANLKYFFPNGDSMVCMIDDRADVWNDAPNLVHVKPYKFFTDTGYMSDPSEEKEKIGYFHELHDNDNDDHLLHLEKKLRAVHREFYEMYERLKENGRTFPDVRDLVPRACADVLKSVNVVFSGIIPTNISPESHKTWKLAELLGAVIQPKVVASTDDPGNKPTTHVISNRTDTEKVFIARKLKNIHIVNPDWLCSCAERWQKADEKLFPVIEAKKNIKPNKNEENKMATTTKPLLDRRGVKNKRQEPDLEEAILNPSKKHHLDPKN